MHSLWSALKKRNYLYVCIKSSVCLASYIIYHNPVRYLGHIRDPGSSKKRHFFEYATYQFGPSFWQYSFLFKKGVDETSVRVVGHQDCGVTREPSSGLSPGAT